LNEFASPSPEEMTIDLRNNFNSDHFLRGARNVPRRESGMWHYTRDKSPDPGQ
jgi:hypothetical protein